MLPMGIIVGAVLVLVLTTLRRMYLNGTKPVLMWVLLLASAALPLWVGYRVLFPGEPADVEAVAGPKSSTTLHVPRGYSLLVTASLSELEEGDEEKLDKMRTLYTLKLKGDGWSQTVTATIRRKSEQAGGPDIPLDDRQGIQSQTRFRASRWGENLQDRFELEGSGDVKVVVSNWQGDAAQFLKLEAVRSPPPRWLLWGAVVVLGLAAVYCDLRYRTDRLSGDVGFLTMSAVFLTTGVTPLGALRDVLFSLGLGLFAGSLVVGSAGAAAEKLWGPKPEPRNQKRGRRRSRSERAASSTGATGGDGQAG